MKKPFFIIALCSYALTSLAQPVKKQEIKTEISSVVVYLDGAEIQRTKTINLTKGKNELIFKDLSVSLDPKSIQITTDEHVNILAISNKINYLTNVKEKPRVIQLKDSLELLRKQNTNYNNEKDAYKIEKDLLIKNQSIGGQDKGVPINELQLAADFYRKRIMEINKANALLDKKIADNNQLIYKIQRNLNELNAKVSYPRNEVTVLVNCETPKTAKFDLKYVITSAGWSPAYDIKASDINKPIDLIYRAKVYNNSGIDWEDIKIKLSTGDPSLSATQPKLTPWYLNFYTPVYRNYDKINQSKAYSGAPQQTIALEKAEGYIQNNAYSLDETITKEIPLGERIEEIQVSELSAEFDIKTKYSIPSDNKPYIVDVVEYNLPTTYKHYAVPKLDRDAFLLARITGWQDLNLIEGPANIYFSGTYVGQSTIYTRNPSDTLDISLGRDNKVLVTRTKLKEFSAVKMIGANKKETSTFQIVVKNNRNVPINIDILDQIPVSQNSEIEVTDVEAKEAKKNDTTGEIKWNYTLEPGTSKTLKLSYSIKYPKNKQINSVKTKRKKARFF